MKTTDHQGNTKTRKDPLVWASRMSDGTAVHISEVQTGLSCNCTCPGCKSVLEAVNSQNAYWVNRPHFRHHKGIETDACISAGLLSAAMVILAEPGPFQLPDMVGEGSAKSKYGKRFEKSITEFGLIREVSSYRFIDATDAVLTLGNGEQIYVRLSTQSSSSKQPKNILNIPEIIIQIDDPVLRTADWQTMRRHIRLSHDSRSWCSHPRIKQLDEIATKDASDQASRYERDILSEIETPREKLHRLKSVIAKRQENNNTWPGKSLNQLDIWRYKYRDGADIHSAPRIDFERILREAAEAQSKGERISDMCHIWIERYRLESRPQVLFELLRAGGFGTSAL